MAVKHLRTSPHHIRGKRTVWWYEEPAGITVVQEFRTDGEDGGLLAVKHQIIPWHSIRAALKRLDQC